MACDELTAATVTPTTATSALPMAEMISYRFSRFKAVCILPQPSYDRSMIPQP
jgi:hypothetical protein